MTFIKINTGDLSIGLSHLFLKVSQGNNKGKALWSTESKITWVLRLQKSKISRLIRSAPIRQIHSDNVLGKIGIFSQH